MMVRCGRLPSGRFHEAVHSPLLMMVRCDSLPSVYEAIHSSLLMISSTQILLPWQDENHFHSNGHDFGFRVRGCDNGPVLVCPCGCGSSHMGRNVGNHMSEAGTIIEGMNCNMARDHIHSCSYMMFLDYCSCNLDYCSCMMVLCCTIGIHTQYLQLVLQLQRVR